MLEILNKLARETEAAQRFPDRVITALCQA